MDKSWHYIHSHESRHRVKKHNSNYRLCACHILPLLGGVCENIVRGGGGGGGWRYCSNIFTPGWEYRGVKISYHTGIPRVDHLMSIGKQINCLTKRLFWRTSKKASKLLVTGLVERNQPHKKPVIRKMFPFGDVIMKMCYVCRRHFKCIFQERRVLVSDQNFTWVHS